MAQDAPNLREVESLLRQGKVAPALAALSKLKLDAVPPRDLLTLNRIGDLLARAGRAEEAVQCYEAIAKRFEDSGFAPKAIAVYKKVLKLAPRAWEAAYRIGKLYAEQKLYGEARAYLLRAVEGWLEEGAFAEAQRACQALVEAEPENPLHRVRLAEARAAGGDPQTATQELLQLGHALLEAGRASEAERTFERAAELGAEPAAARCGQALALAAQDRHEEGLALLRETAGPRARATEALILELAGREGEAAARLEAESDPQGFAAYLRAVVEHPTLRARAAEAWARVDRATEAWAPERRLALLAALADLQPEGHLPALQRLAALAHETGDRAAELQALRRMIRLHESAGRQEEAARLGQRVQALEAAVATEGPGGEPAEAEPVPPPPPEEHLPTVGEGEPDPFEAPAVPLSPEDQEYVTGHLTEAEVLGKYGLLDEALERLRETVARFPGHVEAQARLVELVRAQGDRPALQDSLVGLAVAQRAAGQHEAARDSVKEAARVAPLSESVRARLAALGLLEDAPAAAAVSPSEARQAGAPAERRPGAPRGEARAQEVEKVADEQAAEEIEIFVDEPAVPETGTPPAEAVQAKLDDGTLADIARTLEAQIEADLEGDAQPEAAAGEETLEEILASFRRHVEREVGGEDYRTHYDLGIAYKEMGLLDDALEAFRHAAQSPELAAEAHCMMALCERERGNIGEAVAHYRRAIGIRGATKELQYDLATALLEQGDRDGALQEFQNLMRADPAYRDVRERIEHLTTTG